MAQNWTSYPIGHGYIPGYQGPGTDTPHFADDVETPFHTPITALLSGTVKQADYATWSGQPGGGEVFIKPDAGGDEYYYYHLDDLYVKAGQHVSAGQTVGISGGQNSGGDHNVSPMWSSGPHTHVGYFTKYTDTPAGSRPYGPDITSLLKNGTLANGGIQELASINSGSVLSTFGSSGASGAASCQAPNWWDYIVNPGAVGQYAACQAQAGINQDISSAMNGTRDVVYRIVFVIIGLAFIFFGLKHFLQRGGVTVDIPQISSQIGSDQTQQYKQSVQAERQAAAKAAKEQAKEQKKTQRRQAVKKVAEKAAEVASA